MSKAGAKGRRSRVFWIVMLIYAVLWICACFYIWSYFKGYLRGYEEALPKHGMDLVLEKLGGSDAAAGFEELFSDGRLVTEAQFYDEEEYRAYLRQRLVGKTLTIRESPESTGETPRYVLLADGEEVTDVTLKVAYTNRYSMDIWEYDKFYPDKYCIRADVYTIRVPSSAEVTVDGKLLTQESVALDANGDPLIEGFSELRNVDRYLDVIPTYTTYAVSGLFGDPVVRALDYYTREELPLERSEDGTFFSAELPVDQAIVDELAPRVEDMITAYGEHFIGKNSSAVYKFLLPGSEYREGLSTATTYFYPTSHITQYTFENISVSDFVTYTDNCCSCEIYFDLIVNFDAARYETQNEGSDATWVFIKQDGAWYLADVPRQKAAERTSD